MEKQVNVRKSHYLKQVYEISEKLQITPLDVVKQAIARMYREEIKSDG